MRTQLVDDLLADLLQDVRFSRVQSVGSLFVPTHAKVSHLVASLPTSCLRTACPKLSTSLEQAVNNL